jgi:GTP-binding protein EngB required for normal cell division
MKLLFYNWVNIQRKPWLANDKHIIAFMGKFSAGKSSIINAVLGEKDLLPVDVKPTTAISTYISYAPKVSVKLLDTQDNIRSFPIEKLREISKDTMGDFPLDFLVKHFVVEHRNENLKGKSLLDTPGFSSGDTFDDEIAIEVMQESDVIFWVIDINDGDICKTSLEILQEQLDEQPLYIILNKANTLIESDNKKIVKQVEKTLKSQGKKYEDIILFADRGKNEEKEKYLEELNKILNKLENKEKLSFEKVIGDFIEDFLVYTSDSILENKKELNKEKKIFSASEKKYKKLIKESGDAVETIGELLGNCLDEILSEEIVEDLVEEAATSTGSLLEAIDLVSEINSKEKIIEDAESEIEDLEKLRINVHKVKDTFKTLMEKI